MRIAVWNIECFDQLFTNQNTPRASVGAENRLNAIRDVIDEIDPDLLGIAEAPNTSLSEKKQTTLCLESYAAQAALRQSTAALGFPSPSEKELALLFDPHVVAVTHEPGGRAGSRANPRFEGQWYVEAPDGYYAEELKLLYPPLEARITVLDGGFTFRLLLAYARAKGSPSAAEATRWPEECARSHRRLLAECTWYRRRIDEWLDARDPVVVMGDFNDGPSMDCERAFTARRAVEILMGDPFTPERLLRNLCPRPKWVKQGCRPSTARYQDPQTLQHVHALTEHILFSQDLDAAGLKVWNPYEDDDARALRDPLLEASNHFPVSIDLKLPA